MLQATLHRTIYRDLIYFITLLCATYRSTVFRTTWGMKHRDVYHRFLLHKSTVLELQNIFHSSGVDTTEWKHYKVLHCSTTLTRHQSVQYTLDRQACLVFGAGRLYIMDRFWKMTSVGETWQDSTKDGWWRKIWINMSVLTADIRRTWW